MSKSYGHAIHYSAVEKGTPVYGSDGAEIGRVEQVVDNYAEHILDGFVISDSAGEARFVDAPEVTRTFERAVVLAIDAAAVAELPPPEDGPRVLAPNLKAGKVGRLFGRGWKRK